MQKLPPILPLQAPRITRGYTHRTTPGYQQNRLDDWAHRLAVAQTRRTASMLRGVAVFCAIGLIVLGSCALLGCQQASPEKAKQQAEEIDKIAKHVIAWIIRR